MSSCDNGLGIVDNDSTSGAQTVTLRLLVVISATSHANQRAQ